MGRQLDRFWVWLPQKARLDSVRLKDLFLASFLYLSFDCFRLISGSPGSSKMEAKSWKIASGGSPLCELRFQHAFFTFFLNFACFRTLKNRCFVWNVLQILRFLRFLVFPLHLLSETSFWTHVSSILGSKIVKIRSRTGFGNMMNFWLLFFRDFGDFGIPWGVPGVLSGAQFSCHFRTFGGLGGKFAPARAFWGEFGWFLTIWAVFRCLFWWFFCVFLVRSVVFFFHDSDSD